MNEIKCPHCGKSFTVDEAGYADIVTQVRNREFDAALHERLELAELRKELRIVKMEREILKKATAFFAKESG